MARQAETRARGLSRRGFLGLASAAAGLWIREAWAVPLGEPPAAGRSGVTPALEGEHVPALHVPARTRNGAKVPIVVEMFHPMTLEHHVTSIEVRNAADPLPSKGTYHFTPANGTVYVAFQARMHDGDSEVTATAECSRHGRWSARRRISIPEGAGGCAGAALPADDEDIRPPELRIVELVQRGRILRGEIIHPQLKIRHPCRAGMAMKADGSYVQVSEPLYLEEIEVWFCGEQVSRFELTPALSDDPFVTFALRAAQDGPLEVRLLNNRGQRFEATQQVLLS